MGSLSMENGGVASLGGASAFELRIKKEPLLDLPLSATSQAPDQIVSTTEQLRIKSKPLSDTQLSPVPENTDVSIEEEPDIKDSDVLSIKPQFDHKDAIKKLLDINMEPGFDVSDINTEPPSASKTIREIKNSVIKAAVSSKNDHKPILEQWRKVKIFLYIISCIDPVKPEFSKPLRLKEVLKLFTNPLFKCPEEYSSIAKALIDRIEAQNGFEAPPPPPPPPAAALTIDPQAASSNKHKKRKSVSKTPTSSKRSRGSSTSGSVAPVHLPPFNHLIWGDSGIMRGCLLNLSIRKNFETKDCKIYGHNGLTIGDCWARQIAALRDGAHGAPQAGIVGDVEEGAYSIIISKHYEGFDVDEGDTIEYSAPGAIDSKAKEPESTKHGVIALKRSIVTKNPVRVLRTAGCAWTNRPAMGIRYDGLYRVIEGKVGTNGKGGKYWRFTLKRLRRVDGSEQAPIDTSRPTKQECGLFEKVKEGY